MRQTKFRPNACKKVSGKLQHFGSLLKRAKAPADHIDQIATFDVSVLSRGMALEISSKLDSSSAKRSGKSTLLEAIAENIAASTPRTAVVTTVLNHQDQSYPCPPPRPSQAQQRTDFLYALRVSTTSPAISNLPIATSSDSVCARPTIYILRRTRSRAIASLSP